jgi:acyl carrier protein
MTEQTTADREQVGRRLRTILAEMIGAPAETLTDDTQLFAELGLDSTNALELLMTVEDEFGIEFDPAALAHKDLETVGSLTRYLYNQTGL